MLSSSGRLDSSRLGQLGRDGRTLVEGSGRRFGCLQPDAPRARHDLEDLTDGDLDQPPAQGAGADHEHGLAVSRSPYLLDHPDPAAQAVDAEAFAVLDPVPALGKP